MLLMVAKWQKHTARNWRYFAKLYFLNSKLWDHKRNNVDLNNLQ